MDLEIRDLEFRYKDRSILKGLCLNAYHGQVVGILGENGCGKTTLLKCIDSLLKPSGGAVMVSDFGDGVLDSGSKALNADGTAAVDRMNPKELARSMALVAQSAYVTFPFSVIDMVSMGRYSRSPSGPTRDSDMEVVRQALENAGAIQLAGRNVTELSGGEFRRVMIARALAQEPDILLLDEPTLHLDVCHQFDLMDTVRSLADSMDMTVVIVTHDMVLAARYCDRIILMEHGDIIAEGAVGDVITEDNMRKVFHMDTEIRYDERIGGLNVTLLKRHRDDPEDRRLQIAQCRFTGMQ